VENGSGVLIYRNGNQRECERGQKKLRSCEVPREKKLARKKAPVRCIRRRHASCGTSDNTLTEYGHKEWRDLSGMAPAKQEIADSPDKGRRTNTNPGHFVGSDVMFAVSRSAIRSRENDQTGQNEEFFQGSSPDV